MLATTSAFGVQIDTINQTSEAIEGSGTLTLHNDQSYWQANFDKLTFENQPCAIYSFNRDLAVTEVKMLFKGLVSKKAYTPTQVQFSLIDQLSELRATIPLANISALGLRSSPSVAQAKQRMILGRVFGHRMINLDEVLTGYPLSGTVSISTGSSTLTGVDTNFLTTLSPNDVLTLAGTDVVGCAHQGSRRRGEPLHGRSDGYRQTGIE